MRSALGLVQGLTTTARETAAPVDHVTSWQSSFGEALATARLEPPVFMILIPRSVQESLVDSAKFSDLELISKPSDGETYASDS